jgi:hypothetical protein
VGTSKILGGQGSQNKPVGVSGAYAPGPDEEEEVCILYIIFPVISVNGRTDFM